MLGSFTSMLSRPRLAAYHRRWQEQNKRSPVRVSLRGGAPCLLLGGRTLRTTRQRLDRLTFDNHALHSLVTTFSDPTSRSTARVSAMPLPAFVAGAPADVRGTLVAVHFRDERGFAIF